MTTQRIALATCRQHPGLIAGDDEALMPRLKAVGFEVARVRWDDEAADWSSFDAVLIRTTWDYQEKLAEFLAWVDRVALVTRLFNDPATVRANLDKRYLKQLDTAGVPIVPTEWIESAEGASTIESVMAQRGWGWGVTKPVVGAGASGLLIFGPDELDLAQRHITEQLNLHGGVMVQPLIESVRTRGELSIVLFDGEFSHAVRKTPADGDWRVQIEFGGRYQIEHPTAAELGIAEAATRALSNGELPLYARIDLVEVDDLGPAVIEAELVEPELFFAMVERAGDMLASKLRQRLG